MGPQLDTAMRRARGRVSGKCCTVSNSLTRLPHVYLGTACHMGTIKPHEHTFQASQTVALDGNSDEAAPQIACSFRLDWAVPFAILYA